MKKRLTMILASLFLWVGMALAQTEVSGVIVSQDDGLPVIGATVMVKGTNVGTVSDVDGKFSFTTKEHNPTITISYVGMETLTLKGKKGMKVTMKSDSHVIEEVVVTGMQKMDKRLFTGATTKIDAEKTKLDGIADVSRALEGRVSGVSVQNVSGTFGTAPKIRVRGATSIYGNSKPLWVIDGVIQEDAVDVSADDLSSGDAVTLISNAISGLSADDIESFQVLKDGSATSIYGARAMAGVVVITTKRGKAGRSNINYTGEFTYRLKPNYSEYNVSNSQEQMGIYKEMAAKGWLEFSALANSSSSGLYGKMYTLMAAYDKTNGKFGLPNTDAAMNSYLQEAEFRNTDWFDLLFNNNIVQNHSVSISTGSDKASLYASISAMNDPGWTKRSSVERYTANMNASYKLSKNVTAMILTNASYRDQEAPGTLSQSTNVVDGSVSRSFDINPYSYAMNTSRTLDPNETYTRNYAPFNIFKELDNNYIGLQVMDMKFQGELSWKPLLGLEFRALGAYRTQKSTNEHFILNESNMSEAYRAGVDNPNIMYSNPYLYTDPDKPNSLPISVMPVGGIYTRNDYTVEQLDFRGTVQYNKIWNDTHILNAFGGMEVNKTDKEQIFSSVYGRDYKNSDVVNIVPEFYKMAKEQGTELNGFGRSHSRNIAYFANLSYSYKGRYSVNATGRYEGTNKLGKSRSARWLPTWNVSGMWNAHEEKFFKDWMNKNNGLVSHLALRASYSLTADRGPSWVTNARPVFYADNVWRPQGDQVEQQIYLSNIANTELTYEKKHELNFGLDAGFLNNRINMNFDIYWRDNYDLIGLTQTQGVGGMLTKYANVATMKSNGVEVTLSTRNIVAKDFNWTSDLTFAYAKNEITDLDSKSNIINLVTGTGSSGHFRQGYPVSALFSIPFMGLNDEGLPQVMNADGEITSGYFNFQEYEKLDFLKYEGPTEPTITGGLNNMLTYKNWRLNIFLTYSFGNKIRLDPQFASAYSDMSAMPKEFKNRWVVPGDEQFTDIPTIASVRQYKKDVYLSNAYNAYNYSTARVADGGFIRQRDIFQTDKTAIGHHAYNYSTARVADGGFIRLKDISLTYDLPQSFLQSIGLTTASLKLDATNIWLIYADSKLNGQDPEFVNSGGVASPLPKQFTFTVRIGL